MPLGTPLNIGLFWNVFVLIAIISWITNYNLGPDFEFEAVLSGGSSITSGVLTIDANNIIQTKIPAGL